MKKAEFLKKWSKAASAGTATELFERDVEALVRSTVRLSCGAVARGIKEGARKYDDIQIKTLVEEIAKTIIPAVEEALAKLYE